MFTQFGLSSAVASSLLRIDRLNPALSRAPSVSNSDTFSKSTILNPNQPIGEGGASKLLDVCLDWGKDVSENGHETGGSRAELVSPPQTRAKKGMHIVLSKPYGGSNNRFDVDGHQVAIPRNALKILPYLHLISDIILPEKSQALPEFSRPIS